MRKRSWVWGISTSIILLVISLILNIFYPNCEGSFPVNFCWQGILFIIINFLGLIILSIITYNQKITFNIVPILNYLSIIISIPFYFLIGILLSKLFKNNGKK